MSETGKVMAGLTWRSLKRHPALIPLIFSCGFGACLAAGYTFRLATQCPDVSWNKKTNPEPWQHLGKTGQYKFVAAKHDYKTLDNERPEF